VRVRARARVRARVRACVRACVWGGGVCACAYANIKVTLILATL